MRSLLLLLSTLFISLSIHAQGTWNDYVIGRPMPGYFEAKQMVAKAWGINYQATFAGCVLSDEMSDKSKQYQATNKAYFKTLAIKYGDNWMEEFELEVKKEMHRNTSQEKGIWYELVDNNKDKSFYAAKQVVAQTWGITYKPQFLTKDMSATEKAALTELFLANNDYVQQLENTFGKGWQKILDQEVEFEVAKQQHLANNTATWVDYVVGKPYMTYFEAKKIVAKDWGIAYEVKFQGCELTPKMEKEMAKVEKSNARYFKTLEKLYGEDWKTKFDRAVQKKVAQAHLSQ